MVAPDKRVLIVVVGVWLVTVTAGLAALWAYAERPGPSATAPASWPAAATVPAPAEKPALVMFLHPQCACSEATVGELALLMAHAQGRVAVYVFVYRPADSGPEWARTGLWHAAEAIPGVKVTDDVDAKEARTFGARVSGQVLLYDRHRRLLFNGGITAARGHSGDNPGRSALLALLNGATPATTRTPVFGCFLFSADSDQA